MTSAPASRSSLILVGSFFLILNLFLLAHVGSAEENSEGPYDCMRILLRAAKSSMKALTVCSRLIKENSTSNKDYGDKLPCIMKCAMQRIGLLNEKSLLDDHSLDRMIKKYVPNAIMLEEVNQKVTKGCVGLARKLDPNEEFCKSYADYVLCMQMSIEDYKEHSPWCIKKQKKE